MATRAPGQMQRKIRGNCLINHASCSTAELRLETGPCEVMQLVCPAQFMPACRSAVLSGSTRGDVFTGITDTQQKPTRPYPRSQTPHIVFYPSETFQLASNRCPALGVADSWAPHERRTFLTHRTRSLRNPIPGNHWEILYDTVT